MLKIIRFILNHPISKQKVLFSLFRFFFWQVSYRLLGIKKIEFSLTEKTKMFLKPHLAGSSGNYYVGLLEFEEMAFTLHFLREGDTFFDVGANAGVYSILAAGHCNSNVIAFEPDANSIVNIQENLLLNNIEKKVNIVSKVVGESNGLVRFSLNKDTINHVLIENDSVQYIEKEVCKLDDFENLCPKLLKIDIEGYEWNALNGAKNLLKSAELKAIIIEINGSGSKFGISDNQLHEFLLSFGFETYLYDPMNKILMKVKSFGKDNTLYIRDIEFVNERIENSSSFKILKNIQI